MLREIMHIYRLRSQCTGDKRTSQMFFGSVEANTGEILNIRRSDGGRGGDPLLSFSTALHNYCGGVQNMDSEWIKRLESHAQEPLMFFM